MRTAADGVGARMSELGVAGNGWEEKMPLGLSELGCADGCGRRGCKDERAGSGWKWMGRKNAAGDERAWLRGWLRTEWVKGGGWKWAGTRSFWG